MIRPDEIESVKRFLAQDPLMPKHIIASKSGLHVARVEKIIRKNTPEIAKIRRIAARNRSKEAFTARSDLHAARTALNAQEQQKRAKPLITRAAEYIRQNPSASNAEIAAEFSKDPNEIGSFLLDVYRRNLDLQELRELARKNRKE